MKLSVIMPIYNEKDTVREAIRHLKEAEPADKEIIIVDDGSTDGTREILQGIDDSIIKVILHEKNTGKGGAIRTGLAHAKGEIVTIQDADLEYDPNDLSKLIKPIKDGLADAVFGSRLTGGRTQRVYMFWHKVGNNLVTLIANILYNSTLSDIMTCYKAFRKDFLKDIKIRCNSFDVEPELTAKIMKRNGRVYEIPISYYGRTYNEGKKIRFYHAFGIIWALLRFRFMD